MQRFSGLHYRQVNYTHRPLCNNKSIDILLQRGCGRIMNILIIKPCPCFSHLSLRCSEARLVGIESDFKLSCSAANFPLIGDPFPLLLLSGLITSSLPPLYYPSNESLVLVLLNSSRPFTSPRFRAGVSPLPTVST